MKVLSIIRFKPKPNHLEDVVENLKAHNKKVRKLLNQKRYLSEIDGEIYLAVSYTHPPSPRDISGSRMPSSA